MPGTTKQVAEQEQRDILSVWEKLQSQPQSNERSGLLSACTKRANAIAQESGVPSMLPASTTGKGGKLAALLAQVAADRTEDADAAESTDSE